MGEFYMGEEIAELELGSPLPAVLPSKGLIVPSLDGDGWTRKYLHQDGGRKILISEIPPPKGSPAMGESRPIPFAGRPGAGNVPSLPFQGNQTPLPGKSPFGIGQPMEGRPGQGTVPVRGLGAPIPSLLPIRLAQSSDPTLPAAPTAPAPAAGGTPVPFDGDCKVCPGPMEMPDGRIIQPEDSITLKDICAMMPVLLDRACGPGGFQKSQEAAPQGPYPTQPIRVTPGFPGMGPGNGPFGQGAGFGGAGGGGGGLPGPLGVVQGTPVGGFNGSAGPGPTGPAGPGTGIAFVTKTDGDFSAGPGSFIPIPGTSFTFNQAKTGPVLFMINAIFGCNDAQNNALAIRINGGTPIPVQLALFHTFVSDVGVFYVGASAFWPMTLADGSYTVELMLRGINAGQFCSGTGLGFTATISATPDGPLAFAALYQQV